MSTNLNRPVIQGVQFDSDGGLQISYYTPAKDVTTVGAVHLHTLIVPVGFDYDDEIRAVEDAVHHLIGDVCDDWDRLPKLQEASGDGSG